jgi:putative chitinase
MIAITAAEIRALARDAAPRIVAGIVDNQQAIVDAGIDTPLRLSHFMAQVAHESAHFKVTREFVSGRAYEGRADLGNTRPGDGPRYRGRGLILTIGRANYREATKAIQRMNPSAPDFEQNPAALEQFPWALLGSVAYWQNRKINVAADQDDVVQVTKRVAGGSSGLNDRVEYLNKAKRIWMVGDGANEPQPPLRDRSTGHDVAGESPRAADNYQPTLREGSSGPSVVDLQKSLIEAGFKVEPDGDFGAHTKEAVQAFQDRHGLSADGVFDPAAWDLLSDATREGVAVKGVSADGDSTKSAADEPTTPAFRGDVGGRDKSARDGETNGNTITRPLGRGGQRSAPPPQFFFSLKGEDVVIGNEALWGKAFDLVLGYGKVFEGSLAVLKETKLERVKTGEVALGVEVIPRGLTLTKGPTFGLVRIKDGVMEDPPSFGLKAPEQDDAEEGPHGVYVTFTVTGAIIYGFFLEIRLVEELSKGPHAARTIDLDLEEVKANKRVQRRVARFNIQKKGGSWLISGGVFEGKDILPEETTVVTESSLDEAYQTSISKDIKLIADKTAWRFVDDKLDLASQHNAVALACMQKAMTVGNRLYRRFSADKAFKKMIDLIESLPPGSKITIQTDGEVFPWEFFYPLTYVDNDRPENFKPEKFWGHRFLIESLLLPPAEGETPPANHVQKSNLYVSMGMNSEIDTQAPWVGKQPLPIQVQKKFFNDTFTGRGSYVDRFDDIVDIVRKPDPASLIYFFCHGTAQELQFDKAASRLTADNLVDFPDYPGWPVVFINACDAGNISPLSFYSFRTEFRKRKAAGVIAPSFPVPTMFAAMFANAFLKAYAQRETVGETLLNLRRELLLKNNPLGLWYSLQCPLDVRAP